MFRRQTHHRLPSSDATLHDYLMGAGMAGVAVELVVSVVSVVFVAFLTI